MPCGPQKVAIIQKVSNSGQESLVIAAPPEGGLRRSNITINDGKLNREIYGDKDDEDNVIKGRTMFDIKNSKIDKKELSLKIGRSHCEMEYDI